MERVRPLAVVWAFGCFLASTLPVQTLASDSYTFSLNGKPITPRHFSLNGDPSTIAPGDVILLDTGIDGEGTVYVTLGEERDCRFVRPPFSDSTASPSARDPRIFLESADGRRKVVAVSVTSWFRSKPADPNHRGANGRSVSEEVRVNPLSSMTPAEIRALWGIFLDDWPNGVEQQLANVDTARVCISITCHARVGGTASTFPPLPRGLRYLIIKGNPNSSMSDYSYLKQFRNLAFLMFKSMKKGVLNDDLICRNTSLRHLDLSGSDIQDCGRLAALTELRFLNISRCRMISDIGFATSMRELRTLDISLTRVPSLAPLNDNNSIRCIDASMTEVRALPKGTLGSLKTMDLMSSQAKAGAVEEFRKAHPGCMVRFGWVDSLRQAIQGTTRLRVRSGGTCHRDPNEEKTLAEIMDTAEIERVVQAIDIDASQSDGACACCGNPTFEFYAGDKRLAMIGYHHGKSLRWAGGSWPCDAVLTDTSRKFLNSWLSQHAVAGPQKEVEANQKQRDETIRRESRYAELIPGPTLAAASKAASRIAVNEHSWYEKRRKAMTEAFIAQEKDAPTSITLYLRVLGVTADGSWNMYYTYEDIAAKQLLPRFKGADIAQAAGGLMQDNEAVMGVARWFLGEGGWRNLDTPESDRLLPPLAQRALQHRVANTRKEVMYVLSQINRPWATELLRGILAQPVDPNWAPPKFPSGRTIDAGGGDKVCTDECADPMWAAFCLAQMHDADSASALQKLADAAQGRNRELLGQALRLLRDQDAHVPADVNRPPR